MLHVYKILFEFKNYDNNGEQFLQNFIFSSLTDSEKLNKHLRR